MLICNSNIEFFYNKGLYLCFNNKVYAVEFNPAIDICPIVAGVNDTLTLMNDGTVKAWGYNGYGQLGLGDITYRSTPTLINGLLFNTKPNLTIQSLSPEYKFTTVQDSFIQSIAVTDIDNDTLSCKYYINTETTPRGTKIVSNIAIQQVVDFSPVNLSTMDDGSYTTRFEVSDGQEIVSRSLILLSIGKLPQFHL